jgi:hypothetical protein
MLKTEFLENLLIKNWTHFIDPTDLFALVLTSIENLPICHRKNISFKNSTQITISDIKFKPGILTLWADYIVPKGAGKQAVGTCEIDISLLTYEVEKIETIGNLFCEESSFTRGELKPLSCYSS